MLLEILIIFQVFTPRSGLRVFVCFRGACCVMDHSCRLFLMLNYKYLSPQCHQVGATEWQRCFFSMYLLSCILNIISRPLCLKLQQHGEVTFIAKCPHVDPRGLVPKGSSLNIPLLQSLKHLDYILIFIIILMAWGSSQKILPNIHYWICKVRSWSFVRFCILRRGAFCCWLYFCVVHCKFSVELFAPRFSFGLFSTTPPPLS